MRSLLSGTTGSWLQHPTGFLKPILKRQGTVLSLLPRMNSTLHCVLTILYLDFIVIYIALLHLFIFLFSVYSSLHSSSHSTLFY